ncbi:Aminotransferase tdiD [Sparassis crispa]|uniref:Aminotransferase tdiD n=1 Tax=Sparassis crispa TaxID=139825 RepID=A0A401H0K2_9APHY|nr:Aminotransferase tdiD [Sparassis crispa]GBE87948.1 Aminotransferase tdiD [Sparassis crispa]
MVNSLPPEFYTPFLSDAAKARKPSPIRSLYPLEAQPGVISLLAGKPNGDTFPLVSVQLRARMPEDPAQVRTTEISGQQLAEALQYGPTAGTPALTRWIFGLQEREHGRCQREGWRISVGTGSQDVIFKAFHAIVNPGDAVLVENPVYAGVLPILHALHCDLVEIPTDSQGILSGSLRSTLENWPASKPKPKALYTVPYGCNPTGTIAALERRREVLDLAREHNFLILEDDPYYYLYFGSAERCPSYFKLELEQPEVGRVLRFDSLSKILSSGLRIGFVSGPEPLLQAIDMHTAVANLQPSSLTQIIAFSLLDSWGYDGFRTHTQNVSRFYREKRDMFERALQRHLAGLAEWNTPEAGMFYWFKLLLGGPDEGDSEILIRTKAYEHGVLALPGTTFLPSGGKTAYVRASFSMVSEEEMEEAAKRLRQVVLDERRART